MRESEGTLGASNPPLYISSSLQRHGYGVLSFQDADAAAHGGCTLSIASEVVHAHRPRAEEGVRRGNRTGSEKPSAVRLDIAFGYWA